MIDLTVLVNQAGKYHPAGRYESPFSSRNIQVVCAVGEAKQAKFSSSLYVRKMILFDVLDSTFSDLVVEQKEPFAMSGYSMQHLA